MEKNPIDAGMERLKKYQAIAQIAALLNKKVSVAQVCDAICTILKKTMRYPDNAVTRVRIGEISRSTAGFRTTSWGLSRSFQTSDSGPGSIEVYYTREMDWPHGFTFISDEVDLFDKVAFLLSGAVTKDDFERLLFENIERNKELSGLDRISAILKRNEPLQTLLQQICQCLPGSWKYPEHAGARLIYGDLIFSTPNFKNTPWLLKQRFQAPEGPAGSIEICYLKEFPPEDEGPFLKEERWFLNNIAQLLAVASGCKMYEQMVTQNRERLKELSAINQTTRIVGAGKPIPDTLQHISSILPASWFYSEFAVAKITYENQEYVSRPFEETPWVQREQFITIDNQVGVIEVYYLKEFPSIDEGPFLKEERDLICNIARLVAHFINNEKGRRLLDLANKRVSSRTGDKSAGEKKTSLDIASFESPVKYNYTVKNILIVCSIYDAHSIVNDGSIRTITDPLLYQSCWSIPKMTFAHSIEQAGELLTKYRFDMVFVLANSGNEDLSTVHTALKSYHPDMAIRFLIRNKNQLSQLKKSLNKLGNGKTEVFMWNNDPDLIILLCKLYEDMLNSDQITAPTVLVVEDSPEFYTLIIQSLYDAIFKDLLNKIDLSVFSRFRIILANNYDEAVHYLSTCRESIVAIFSDMEFEKNGTLRHDAGCELLKVAKEYAVNIMAVINSTDRACVRTVENEGARFLDKNSETLYRNIHDLLLSMTTFKINDENGNPILEENTIGSLLKKLSVLDNNVITGVFKSKELIFRLKAHGYFDVAETAASIQNGRFDENELTTRIYELLKDTQRRRFLDNRISVFTSREDFKEKSILTISQGSLGGKGRSVAFLDTLVTKGFFEFQSESLVISSPVTLIIRSDEYERIIDNCAIGHLVQNNGPDAFNEIKNRIDQSDLSSDIMDALKHFIEMVSTPIAVRSSSLFEDSLTQPFSGVFETYIIPNSNPDPSIRLRQLVKAIKRVYASVFRPEARMYFSFTGKNIPDERMAVVIQQLVGVQYDGYYYPQMCGVASSYNFYPVGHMKPEDGFVSMAFGLGVYVVEGRSGHRFSPVLPEIDFGSIKDLLNGTQTQFYAVNTAEYELDFDKSPESIGLCLLDIDTAERNGSLVHCASVYDWTNDRIVPNLRVAGPRIIDFADILKHHYIPLAEMLHENLEKLSTFVGSPVEIEFAVNTCNRDKARPELNILQVKPLVGEQLGYDLDSVVINPEKCILYSETALGNGKNDSLHDILIINPDQFNRLKTEDMVREVEYFNRKQMKENNYYLLIGPGRWGTRDKSLGIPVVWSQICNAKVIIEVGTSNYPLDASLGSHFFHNVTAMQVGYIAVNEQRGNEFINWNAFHEMKVVESLKYFRLLHAEKPLSVQIDGKKKKAVIIRS